MDQQFSLFGGKQESVEETAPLQEKADPPREEMPPKAPPRVAPERSHSPESRLFQAHAKDKSTPMRPRPAPVPPTQEPFIPAAPDEEPPAQEAVVESPKPGIHVFRFHGEQMSREKILALRDFLRNNPGETKVGIDAVLKDEDGQEYVCSLSLPDNLAIKESPEIDVAVESIMRM